MKCYLGIDIGTSGTKTLAIDVTGKDGQNLLQMSGQPRLGPWRFDFNAPLSVCQASGTTLGSKNFEFVF